MEINPAYKNYPGLSTGIPADLQSFVTEWANAQFFQFNSGSILSQWLSCKLYHIYLFRLIITNPVHLALTVHHPTLGLQFMLTGFIKTVEIFRPGTFGLMYLPAGRHRFRLEPGEYEAMGIELSPVLLEQLSESNDQVKALVEFQLRAGDKVKRLEPLAINYRIRSTIEDMIHCRESGDNLLMEFSTAIGNLLNLYRKELNDRAYSKGLPEDPYKEVLISIRDEIRSDPNKVKHTVQYFSSKYNISGSTLKRAFKGFYKKTLGSFVTEECMKKAAFLIRDYSLSFDSIADKLGYSERSGFLRAYRRVYGKAPKRRA